MLVKLHGGPSHGKVVQVRDGWMEVIVNNFKAADRLFTEDYGLNPAATVNYTTTRYVLRKFRNPLHPSEVIPCLSPKGEVIFFHDKDF